MENITKLVTEKEFLTIYHNDHLNKFLAAQINVGALSKVDSNEIVGEKQTQHGLVEVTAGELLIQEQGALSREKNLLDIVKEKLTAEE